MLVTKWRDYRDVGVHVKFMVVKGSNSGVIFHGNHEIRILDSSVLEDGDLWSKMSNSKFED